MLVSKVFVGSLALCFGAELSKLSNRYSIRNAHKRWTSISFWGFEVHCLITAPYLPFILCGIKLNFHRSLETAIRLYLILFPFAVSAGFYVEVEFSAWLETYPNKWCSPHKLRTTMKLAKFNLAIGSFIWNVAWLLSDESSTIC